MKTADLLRAFKVSDPKVQSLIEAVAEHAYVQGRRDASMEFTRLALETDERVADLLKQTIPLALDSNFH